MTGVDMYSWMAPIFGQAGVDYLTALWAVVVAEYVGQWAMGVGAREELPNEASPNVDLLTPIVDEVEATNLDGRCARQKAGDQQHNPLLYLLAALFLLMLPSYETPILPLPAHSPNTTEVTVGCVHPYVSTPGTAPTLDDYIGETLTQANRAKILLWPEGAVQFRTEAERSTVFERIANASTQRNAWIAVGYEQLFTEGGETSHGKRVRGHNGLAIFGPRMEPVKYLKRRLVPCKAMFAHASMRALEQGASVLWCDGGEGGVSGIGGLAASGLGTVGGIGQVGTGASWVQTIGVPFPYDAKDFTSTWYSRWGDLTIIFLAWIMLCAGFTVPAWHGLQTVLAVGRNRLEGLRGDEHRRVERNENTPLLVDA
ncbi:hypothetical protein FRC06_011889 [Ceratobasidium sp. 370]|nr:hypothetical protein FRC06_011889 [Ceratobasidium sp. 370]